MKIFGFFSSVKLITKGLHLDTLCSTEIVEMRTVIYIQVSNCCRLTASAVESEESRLSFPRNQSEVSAEESALTTSTWQLWFPRAHAAVQVLTKRTRPLAVSIISLPPLFCAVVMTLYSIYWFPLNETFKFIHCFQII